MKHIFNLFIVLAIIHLAGCSPNAPLAGKINIDQIDDWHPTVYLIRPNNLDEIARNYGGDIIDSTQIDHKGRFSFRDIPNLSSRSPQLFLLTVQKKGEKYPNQLDNEHIENGNYLPIIIEKNQPIFLEATIDKFQASCQINNPSINNQAILVLRDTRLQAYKKWKAKKYPDQDEYIIAKAEALHDFQKPLMEFANQTDQLYPALIAIRWVSPVNDYERVPEFLQKQCEKWQDYSDSPFVQGLCKKAAPQTLPILIGHTIPDMSLPMLDQSTKKLSQLLGKKLTLIDFWASWCAPCRKENRTILVPLWEETHKKGFAIIGYGLESDAQAWQAAIQKDGAYRWQHASHLQGDEAPLMALFRIQTIPANFLVDQDGKVIAKNLHGDDLVNFIKNFLND